MFIQCHSCNTKYRLNLESIPKRKTFIRCKSCGTPIYIDPTEEEPLAASVIPPGSEAAAPVPPGNGGTADGGGVQVICPECDSRYRMEAGILRPGIKLKCSQCQAVFPVPVTAVPVTAPGGASGGSTPDFHPPPPPDNGEDGPAGDMPLPDEEQVEVMFDDLRPDHSALAPEGGLRRDHTGPIPRETELGALDGESFGTEPPAPDSDQAYLDATSFQDDDAMAGLSPQGSVPDDQKYKYFLKPDEFGKEDADAEEPRMPEEDLPPLDEEIAESGPTADAPEDIPDLPVVRDEAEKHTPIPEVRDPVPGQESTVLSEKRVLMLLSAACVTVLVGAGLWGWWLATSSNTTDPFRVQIGQTHQLALEENLQGHFVTNKPSRARLFVVNGEVENRFGKASKVRWIRIKGTVFGSGEGAKPLGLAFAYAGNRLQDDQLIRWDLEAIRAFYGFSNGRDDVNIEIPSGAKVRYQLVFTNIGQNVGRAVAEVMSYHRGGQAVFIENP